VTVHGSWSLVAEAGVAQPSPPTLRSECDEASNRGDGRCAKEGRARLVGRSAVEPLATRRDAGRRGAGRRTRTRSPAAACRGRGPTSDRRPAIAGCRVFARARMSGDETRLRAMAQALARIARAAALRLPREVVDDAAQDAWVRWLDACGGEDADGPAAEPLAFLVGCFHHACADAVRAHRRRQRLQLLAADASGEPIDVADATGAHASWGGASNSSSTRSCDQRSPDCLRPTSSCGSPPRSTASGGARRARQPGWTRRRSSGRDEESPDFCPRKTCSDAYSIGWTTFRDGHGAWYAADSRRFTEACQVLQACIAVPLVLLFVSAGWRAFLPEEVECRLNVGWAQVGVPSISCSGRCPSGICQDQHLEWTDPAGFDHVVSMCGCGDDLPRVACQGWVEVIYSNPIEIDGGCLWPEGCILQECVALPLGNWPMRPGPRVPACECQ